MDHLNQAGGMIAMMPGLQSSGHQMDTALAAAVNTAAFQVQQVHKYAKWKVQITKLAVLELQTEWRCLNYKLGGYW